MIDLTSLTIHACHDLLQKREISAVELTQAYLERIESLDEQIKAYLHVAPEAALSQAAAADERRAAGEDNPLLGVPLAIKDMITLEGMPTTAASRILQGFMPPYEATVTRRLRERGAVFLGKTNTDEFAMGWSTENSAYFTTHNPYNLSRVPGGSSGGSAAAVRPVRPSRRWAPTPAAVYVSPPPGRMWWGCVPPMVGYRVGAS